MNDEPDLEPDPDLDVEEDARVRALLADLGADPGAARMPSEVADRLEETIAGLVADRRESAAVVVPLHRRWGRRGAAIAAAVIVVGAGGVAAANLGGFGGAGSSSSGSTADSSAAGESSGRAPSTAASGTVVPSPPGALAPSLAAQLPRVSAASFETDVARVLQRSPAPQDTARQRNQLDSSGKSPALVCPGPVTSDGATTRSVLYDGTRAALVVHPARDGERVVEAWTCTGDRRLHSATLPAAQPGSGASTPGLGTPSPTPQD